MPKLTPTDPSVREDAERLAAEVGPAEASRRTGIPASTLRAWRRRAPRVEPAPAAAPDMMPPAGGEVVSAEELHALARRLLANASEAQEAVTAALRRGKLTQAYHGSLSGAIGIDKIAGIIEAIERMRGREDAVTEAQGRRLGEVLRLALAAVCGDAVLRREGPALRELMAACLRATRSTGPVAMPDGLGEPIREEMQREWLRELRTDRRALPAPAEAAVEVVDAEVVSDAQGGAV